MFRPWPDALPVNQLEEAQALDVDRRHGASQISYLERRGYDQSRFNQVKREMADVRGFKMGDEGIEYVIGQMMEGIHLPPARDPKSLPDKSSWAVGHMGDSGRASRHITS